MRRRRRFFCFWGNKRRREFFCLCLRARIFVVLIFFGQKLFGLPTRQQQRQRFLFYIFVHCLFCSLHIGVVKTQTTTAPFHFTAAAAAAAAAAARVEFKATLTYSQLSHVIGFFRFCTSLFLAPSHKSHTHTHTTAKCFLFLFFFIFFQYFSLFTIVLSARGSSAAAAASASCCYAIDHCQQRVTPCSTAPFTSSFSTHTHTRACNVVKSSKLTNPPTPAL